MPQGKRDSSGNANLFISVGDHISDSPALILEQVPQGRQQDAVAGLLFLGNFLRNRNKNIHRKETHAILVVTGKVLEQGYHFFDDNWRVQFFDKLGEIIRRLSPHHRGLVVHQRAEILSKALLQGLGRFLVWDAVQTGGGYFRREPVRFR